MRKFFYNIGQHTVQVWVASIAEFDTTGLTEITENEYNVYWSQPAPDGKQLIRNAYPFEFEAIPVIELCIETCRSNKLAEMRKECDDAIATLFQSEALGTDKTYSYDCREIDQINLQSIVVAGNGGSIYVHDGVWFNEVVHTHEQAKALLASMVEHVRIQRFDKLKPYVASINAAATIEAIEAVVWA